MQSAYHDIRSCAKQSCVTCYAAEGICIFIANLTWRGENEVPQAQKGENMEERASLNGLEHNKSDE